MDSSMARVTFSPTTAPMVPPIKPNSIDRKSTRLNSSHSQISYAVFCLKKKKFNAVSDNRQHSIRHATIKKKKIDSRARRTQHRHAEIDTAVTRSNTARLLTAFDRRTTL